MGCDHNGLTSEECWEIAKEEQLTKKYPGKDHIIPLLPCPLCGGDAHFIEYCNAMVYFVECEKCKLTLGLEYGYSSRLDAVANWNSRV